MKMITLILTLALVITGCTFTSETKQSQLPVIDVNKEYPLKRIDIHEIADVEYIPLETTDSSMLQVDVSISITDNCIMVSDILQHIVVFFDRKGKYLHTVNRYGRGPGEYVASVETDIDGNKKELYIWDLHNFKLFTYTWNGTNIATHGYAPSYSFEFMKNYDENYLIAYNDIYWPSPIKKYERKADPCPYYLISKKDGKLKRLDKRLMPKEWVHPIFNVIKGQNGYYTRAEHFKMPHIIDSGDDFLLTENSLDTLYNYKNHQLEPVFVRAPSASTMETPKLIYPCVFNEFYFIFRILPMDYEIGLKHDFDSRMMPAYILDRRTNEICRLELYDSLLDPELKIQSKRGIITAFPENTEISIKNKNHAASRYQTSILVEKYKEGKLKGKLKEIASKLKEDDNNVVAIFKFK